jgi:hypothetical protein
MSQLVWRAERYDGLSFLIFATSPALVMAPWWLAMAWLVGAWLLTR